MSDLCVAWLAGWQGWPLTVWVRLAGMLLVGVGGALAWGRITRRTTQRHSDVARAYSSGEYRGSFGAGRLASLALALGAMMVGLSAPNNFG